MSNEVTCACCGLPFAIAVLYGHPQRRRKLSNGRKTPEGEVELWKTSRPRVYYSIYIERKFNDCWCLHTGGRDVEIPDEAIPALVRTICPEIDALREVAEAADALCNGVVCCRKGERDAANLYDALDKLRAARKERG